MTIKLFFRVIILFSITMIVMLISWSVGNVLGNLITNSTPPAMPDPEQAGLIFMAVCAVNSLLISILIIATRSFSRATQQMVLTLFVFTLQTMLPQMETFFFGSKMGISYAQITSIVIAGTVMSVSTVMIAVVVYRRFTKDFISTQVSISSFDRKRSVGWIALLSCVVYPFLYMTFGYYVAWQNENLRVYYESTTEMNSYFESLTSSFGNGIYFFQVLRSLIWIGVTIPVIGMLNGRPNRQLIIIGLVTAVLPSSLLLIPNPYMPHDVAMSHFIETLFSNLIWGVLMVLVMRRQMLR